jgi:DNA-binding beta-propeller fold protein YncE
MELRPGKRALVFALLACLPLAAQVAPIPAPTQLSSNPFFIKNNWFIGGTGSWDYLTIDPAAQRLYIAHSHNVQVVDLSSGSLAGEISGFREAHAIALDDTGMYGYVSDGPADTVAVFDRRSLKIESTAPISCSPRSLAFEPRSKLLFSVCGANLVNAGSFRQPGRWPSGNTPRPPRSSESTQEGFAGISHVIAIDTQKMSVIADIAITGDFRFAHADGAGAVYVTVGETARFEYRNGATRRYVSPQRIAKFDGPALAAEADRMKHEGADPAEGTPVSMDWSEDDGRGARANFVSLLLPASCAQPQGLNVDSKDNRLFIACNDQQLMVVSATNGHVITTLTTGPGADVVGYDPDRQLIFSANGDGYGSLTIIQQDANTDSFAVIQNLPTLARARTLAIDHSTGNVYLVTDYTGVDLTPRGAFGPIQTKPIEGSFQVLVIGH